jgi:hypothetical protein
MGSKRKLRTEWVPGRPSAQEVRERALMRRARAVDPAAQAIAQEVYEAAETLAPGAADDPLPLAVRAPLFAINVRALEVIRSRLPDLVADEAAAMDVIAYMTDGWCAMMLEFDRGHFEEWRSRKIG